MDLGRAVIRGVIGPLFVGHGTQKLFGWFGGHGVEGTGGFFESVGLRPGRRHATAAGVAETAGGALLTLGALTPLAATMISATMLTAIRKVHIKQGPWVTNNGYEYNLVVIAAMAAITEIGPGRPSVDSVRFPNLKGTSWSAAMLAAAAAGSALATSSRFVEAAPVEPEPARPETGDQPPRFTREQPAEATAEVDAG
jgi:putative oxidoreductase